MNETQKKTKLAILLLDKVHIHSKEAREARSDRSIFVPVGSYVVSGWCVNKDQEMPHPHSLGRRKEQKIELAIDHFSMVKSSLNLEFRELLVGKQIL